MITREEREKDKAFHANGCRVAKSVRDTDRVICEAATQGRWVGFPTGILVGPRWVVSNTPDAKGRIMTGADAEAAANAVNQLPLYIADAEEAERRIAEIETAADEAAKEGLRVAGEHGLDAAHNARTHEHALRFALRILRGET